MLRIVVFENQEVVDLSPKSTKSPKSPKYPFVPLSLLFLSNIADRPCI